MFQKQYCGCLQDHGCVFIFANDLLLHCDGYFLARVSGYYSSVGSAWSIWYWRTTSSFWIQLESSISCFLCCICNQSSVHSIMHVWTWPLKLLIFMSILHVGCSREIQFSCFSAIITNQTDPVYCRSILHTNSLSIFQLLRIDFHVIIKGWLPLASCQVKFFFWQVRSSSQVASRTFVFGLVICWNFVLKIITLHLNLYICYSKYVCIDWNKSLQLEYGAMHWKLW